MKQILGGLLFFAVVLLIVTNVDDIKQYMETGESVKTYEKRKEAYLVDNLTKGTRGVIYCQRGNDSSARHFASSVVKYENGWVYLKSGMRERGCEFVKSGDFRK